MLLEARAITKTFGSFRAVDGVTIGVEPGTILGLIGPNGAGKSTLFNCLTGDILPTAGEVLIEGRDVTRLAAGSAGALRPRPHLPGAADLRPHDACSRTS